MWLLVFLPYRTWVTRRIPRSKRALCVGNAAVHGNCMENIWALVDYKRQEFGAALGPLRRSHLQYVTSHQQKWKSRRIERLSGPHGIMGLCLWNKVKCFLSLYHLVNYSNVFGKVFLIFETYYVCDERHKIARNFRYIESILHNFIRWHIWSFTICDLWLKSRVR
jgi:hypothetical protein